MLPQVHRLPRLDVSRVLRGGKIIRADGFDIRYLDAKDMPRFAFVVSKKVEKRATHRNRMKRLMSEAVYRILPDLRKPIHAVIIIRKAMPDTFDRIVPMLSQALRVFYG